MSNPVWVDIASSRIAAGNLWPSQLSLDLLARDWGAGEIQFEMYWPESTHTTVGAASKVQYGTDVADNFRWRGNAIWAADDTFGTLEHTLYLRLLAKVSSGSVTLTIDDPATGTEDTDYSTATVSSTSYDQFYEIWRRYDGLPVGDQTFELWAAGSLGLTLYTKKDRTDGPNCRVEISIT